MTLEEFKFIWWMEYTHRMWGRAIGAFFLVPAGYFWYKGWFPTTMKRRVVAFGALILAQVRLYAVKFLTLNNNILKGITAPQR